jgi:hypothetical protein
MTGGGGKQRERFLKRNVSQIKPLSRRNVSEKAGPTYVSHVCIMNFFFPFRFHNRCFTNGENKRPPSGSCLGVAVEGHAPRKSHPRSDQFHVRNDDTKVVGLRPELPVVWCRGSEKSTVFPKKISNCLAGREYHHAYQAQGRNRGKGGTPPTRAFASQKNKVGQ